MNPMTADQNRNKRIEEDSMGTVHVPEDAYYGAQTQRAKENFPVSGYTFTRPFLWAIGHVKKAAATVNEDLGLLDSDRAGAIQTAADELIHGDLDDHFPLDIFQTGSGTSTNMNANEVLSNRAIELRGGEIGDRSVHPNDHVNMGQSSNDVIPSSIHLSVLREWYKRLKPSLEQMQSVLERKSEEMQDVVKVGRTHLQDATPVTLGQELGGHAAQIRKSIRRIDSAADELKELPIGGTAVGTGLNTHPEFADRVCSKLQDWTGYDVRETDNHFESQGARDALVDFSGSLRTLAVGLMKIANDVRWLGSGPRCGIGEMKVPAVQPGSSIMPGKINPVLAESVTQVAAQVMGSDTTVSVAGQSGNFELNVMMPVMAYNVLESQRLLANVTTAFSEKCLEQIEPDEDRCQEMVEQSLALVTNLAPEVGYDQAAEIAKEAHKTGKTIREVALERDLLPAERLDELLDPSRMLSPDQKD